MIKSPNQIKWSLEKSLKQKGDFQRVCVALIRLLVSIGLMMSDVWGYQPESKVRLSPAKIFPEIKQPDLMPLTVWGQSLMISLCLLQQSERTQCWKLGLFSLSLLYLSWSESEKQRGGVTSCLTSKVSSFSPGLFATSCGDWHLFERLLVTNLCHPTLLSAASPKTSALADASSMWRFTESSSGSEGGEYKWQPKSVRRKCPLWHH